MKLDRTNQLLLGTSVVLLAFTGLRLWQDSRPPAPLRTIDPIQALEVTAIDLRQGDRHLRLERGERWAITEPRPLSADEEAVGTFLREWAEGLTPDLRIQPGDATVDSWGLDEAQRSTVTLEGEAGNLVSVHLGSKVSGGSHYLSWAGEDGIYRGRVPGAHRLDFDVAAWRDNRLFPFAKDDLAGLVVDGEHGRFAFERVETERRAFWQAAEGTDFAPSSRTLDGIARSLADVKAVSIIEGADAEAARAEQRFEGPSATLTTEAGVAWVLRLGGDADKGVWASVEGDERLFVLPRGAANQLRKDRAALRDRTILRLTRADQTRLTWTQGSHALVVVPEGERDWRIAEPAGWDDRSELGLAANSLLNLQAVEVLDTPHPTPGPDAVRIDAVDDEGAHTLWLVPDGDRWLGFDPSRPPTFVVRGAVLDRLFKVFGAREG